MKRVLVVFVVVASVACKSKAKPTGAGSGSAASGGATDASRLFLDNEIAEQETALMGRIEISKQKRCATGPAAQAMVSLFEPTGTLADCVAKLTALQGNKQLEQLVQAPSPELVAFDASCGAEIEKALALATSVTDRCSAYQTGVRIPPDKLLSVLRIAHALALRAQIRADKDVPGALQLLATGVQLFQDFTRGRTNLLITSTSAAAVGILLDRAEALMPKLTAVTPDLVKAWDQAIANEPPIDEILAGEHDYAALHLGLAALKPASWNPPGGRNEMTAGAPDPAAKLPPQDFAGILLASKPMCMGTPDLGACKAELDLLAKRDKATEEELVSPDLLIARLRPTADSRERLQRHVLEHLHAANGPLIQPYIALRAEKLSRLAGARIALEARQLGKCWTAEELKATPFAALRAPQRLYPDRVTVTTDGGTLVVTPPEWAISKARGKERPWTSPCP